MYINALEEGVTSKISKFADELIRKTKESADEHELQDHIDKLVKSKQWQMLFIHTHGHGNTGKNYEMGGTFLCKTVKEKYLD